MLVRSATTATFVLGGSEAGVTVTVSSVLPAGSSEFGEARPLPEGWPAAPPPPFAGEALLRGIGPAMRKSLRLLSVSMQPLLRRTAAFVLLSAGVGGPSKQFALPEPTRSATPLGHAPLSAAVPATSATFAFVALMVMTPVASGAGSGVVPPVPGDSCTR